MDARTRPFIPAAKFGHWHPDPPDAPRLQAEGEQGAEPLLGSRESVEDKRSGFGAARLTWLGAVVAAAGVAVACAAAAEVLAPDLIQQVPGFGNPPADTVLARPRPLYDPVGVRAGGLLFTPTLDESIGYDSNLLGQSAPRGSWMLGTRPSLLASSDDPAHPLAALLSIDDARAIDLPSQSRTNWLATAGGTILLGHDSLTISAAHQSLHEDPIALGALHSDTPIAYQVDEARVAYTLNLNRLSITPSLGVSAWRYSPTTISGQPTSEAYQDRDVVQGEIAMRYRTGPLADAVLILRGLRQYYTAPAPGAPSNDSYGWTVLAGFEYARDEVWRYRLLAGWEQRDFSAPQFGAHGAVVAEAETIWSPSRTTTVTASLTRQIEDAAQQGVAGFTETSAKVDVAYEYQRNLLFDIAAGLSRAEFLGSGGTQSELAAGVGATWLINRYLRLLARYDFTRLSGSRVPDLTTAGGPVSRSIATLTMRVGL